MSAILRPMENSSCWTLSRVMSEISQSECEWSSSSFRSLHSCYLSIFSLRHGPNDRCQLLHMLIYDWLMQQEVSVVCFEALGVARLPCWRLVGPRRMHDCQLKRPTTPDRSAFYRYFLSSVTIQALQTPANHTDCERLQMFHTNGSHPKSPVIRPLLCKLAVAQIINKPLQWVPFIYYEREL